jgi:hypothetical protein
MHSLKFYEIKQFLVKFEAHSVILLVLFGDFLKVKHEIISRIELKYGSLRISIDIKDNI